mgnify:CR=1 FL=1
MRRHFRRAFSLFASCALGLVVLYGTRCNSNTAGPSTAGIGTIQNHTGDSRRVRTARFEESPPSWSTDRAVFGCDGMRRLVRETRDTQRHSLKSRVQTWETNAIDITHCPDMLSSLPRYAGERDVPPLLHRVWECADIPERYEKGIMSWIDNADDMFVFLWTSEVRKTFINKTLGPGHLDLYTRLLPGAYRADLFRYFVMYYVGGVYSDLDAHLHMDLSSIGYLFSGITLVIDIDAKRLLNGAILMSARKQPIFLCAMGEVFDHSEHRLYFDSDLDISGPGVLAECLRHILGKDNMMYDKKTAADINSLGIHLLGSKISDDGRHVVKLNETDVLISLKPGGEAYDRAVRAECDPGEHYSVLYTEKRVYNDEAAF